MGCLSSKSFDTKNALAQLELKKPIAYVEVDELSESVLMPHFFAGNYYTDDINNEMYFYFEGRFKELVLPIFNNRKLDRETFSSMDRLIGTAMGEEKERQGVLKVIKRKGVAHAYRWSFWKYAAAADQTYRVSELRLENRKQLYARICQGVDQRVKEIVAKDSVRTSKGRVLFKAEQGAPVRILMKVCEALGMFFPKIGYVQGMNFVVAFVLEVSGLEEFETWNFLVDFFKKRGNLFFGVYESGFTLTLCMNFMFHRMLEKVSPETEQKLKAAELPDELYITKWFLSFFTTSLPKDFLLRAWDFFQITNFLGPVYVALVIFCQLESLIRNTPASNLLETIQKNETIKNALDFTSFVKQLKNIESLFTKDFIILTLNDYFNSIDPPAQLKFAYYYNNLSKALLDPKRSREFVSDIEDLDSLPFETGFDQRFKFASKSIITRISQSEKRVSIDQNQTAEPDVSLAKS